MKQSFLIVNFLNNVWNCLTFFLRGTKKMQKNRKNLSTRFSDSFRHYSESWLLGMTVSFENAISVTNDTREWTFFQTDSSIFKKFEFSRISISLKIINFSIFYIKHGCVVFYRTSKLFIATTHFKLCFYQEITIF
jgi:hypothetical protein